MNEIPHEYCCPCDCLHLLCVLEMSWRVVKQEEEEHFHECRRNPISEETASCFLYENEAQTNLMRCWKALYAGEASVADNKV